MILPARIYIDLLPRLEITKRNFVHLVEESPEEDWKRKFPVEIWSIKQEIMHIVQLVQILPAGIARVIAEGKRSLPSYVPAGLRNWVNGRIVMPRKARKESRESIVDSYKVAHGKRKRAVAEITEDDWNKGMPFPREFRTLKQLAYRPGRVRV